MPAAVNDNLSVTRFTAQKFVVILLEPAFADNVAGTQALSLNFGILQFLRADLTDVTKNMRQNFLVGIKSLRLEFDAQLGIFHRMRFNPRDVLNGRVFL